MKDPTQGKHSHNNRESKEGKVLRLIREARKLSLKDVAGKMNLKVAEIDHFENGRKFYTKEDITKFLECYDFSNENFQKLMELNTLTKQVVNHLMLEVLK